MSDVAQKTSSPHSWGRPGSSFSPGRVCSAPVSSALAHYEEYAQAVASTALRASVVGWAALVVPPALLAGAVWGFQRPLPDTPATAREVTLSIVGTTDLHERVFANEGRGGLALLGGYLRNLRAARAVDPRRSAVARRRRHVPRRNRVESGCLRRSLLVM